MSYDLISQYKSIHKNIENYGTTGLWYIEQSKLIIDYLQPKIVLDYGCGKGTLIQELQKIYPNIKFYGYDPAIEGMDILPCKKADLVINTDVLEHIPEAELDDILQKISAISENVFFGLHHALAVTILENGQNAHCTVKPPIWYYNLLSKYFKNPYPLKGHNIEFSSIITFLPTVEFLHKYYELIDYSLNSKVDNLTEEISTIKTLFNANLYVNHKRG